MISSPSTFQSQRMDATHTISITSGKGGVGKTSVVVNLAKSLAQKGYKVLILDGDLGMANVDIMFNTRCEYSILDLIKGHLNIKEVVTEVDRNISLIPGGSGLYALQNMNSFERQYLLDQVSTLGQEFDYMIIDTAPGIDQNVLCLNSAAQEICIVLTPDPASFTDAYALIKVLNQRNRETQFSIICNQVKDEKEGRQLFTRFLDVVQKFLYVRLDYKVSIPMDLNLRQCTRTQQLVTVVAPSSVSSQSFQKLAQSFEVLENPEECKGNLQFFWEQLVGVA